MESKYMTLEEYAATLKVGDEVTIEYYSISGDRQTKEKILKITKSGTIYVRSTDYKNAIRFRKNGQWIDNLGYQGGIFSGYRLKNPHKKPLARRTIDARSFFLTIIYTIGTFANATPFSAYLLLL